MRGRFDPLNRLVMPAVLALTLTVLGTLAAPARGAQAQIADWCWGDPILTIDGHTVNIIAGVMGSPADVERSVRHAHFTIALPPGVDAEIVGYSGDFFTESAEIVRDDSLTYVPDSVIEMRVEVAFDATVSMPVALHIAVDGSSWLIGSGTASDVLSGVFRFDLGE